MDHAPGCVLGIAITSSSRRLLHNRPSGKAWENEHLESFNGRMRDEFLNGEIFYSLREAKIILEEWTKHYNTKRPHSALSNRPPAPEAIVSMDQRPTML